jgi:hypothetical protein
LDLLRRVSLPLQRRDDFRDTGRSARLRQMKSSFYGGLSVIHADRDMRSPRRERGVNEILLPMDDGEDALILGGTNVSAERSLCAIILGRSRNSRTHSECRPWAHATSSHDRTSPVPTIRTPWRQASRGSFGDIRRDQPPLRKSRRTRQPSDRRIHGIGRRAAPLARTGLGRATVLLYGNGSMIQDFGLIDLAAKSCAGGVRGVAAPGRQVSMKRPDAGAERVVSDLVRRSVRFGLSISCKVCAPSGSLIGLSANDCLTEAYRRGTSPIRDR